MAYRAPTADIQFALNNIAGLGAAVESGAFGDLAPDLVQAVLEEAAKFAEQELAPINRIGDEVGAKFDDGKVILPEPWARVYRQWAEGGWAGLPVEEKFGGQGLPIQIAAAVSEMWNSACMAFCLCPTLAFGAIETLAEHGSEDLQRTYIGKLTSGEWTATMNLTEPQAGSDLNALRTRAEPQGDGTYRISGTKIFITYGEHDMVENIIHLVLARLPDAPPGTRGISLFVVPKFLVNPDGSLGAKNDVKCVGIEHKLGIHASPTCVMSYGEGEGAIGWLVGEENRGLNCMFTMMNNARLAVGIQGVAIAEMATQHAREYATERKQGQTPGKHDGNAMLPIVEHPDVRRMLLSMRAQTAAARALCYATAAAIDNDNLAREKGGANPYEFLPDLLTPLAKAYSSDISVEVSSLGIQIHGGMGFVEETGAAQYWRDARILPIFEGTNGIQAIDLVTRKIPKSGGEIVNRYIEDLQETAQRVMGLNRPEFGRMGYRLNEAVGALKEATEWMLQTLQDDSAAALAVAAPYLRLFAMTACGTYLARGILATAAGDDPDLAEHVSLARYYAENHLTEASGLKTVILHASEFVLAVEPSALAV